MDVKERKQEFLKTMLSEQGSYHNPTATAGMMGLSHREFSEATGEVMCMCCKRIARNLVNDMMEEGIGEPFQNEVVAHYVAHTVSAHLAALYIKESPDVNFVRVKQLAKKMTKSMKKYMKETMKKMEEAA